MNKHTRRASLAAATASLLGLFTLLGGPASAVTGGTKGSPQPELKPFHIGTASAGGAVALEPDGGLVVAYGISSGKGKTVVCLLNRGGHSCSHRVTLSPLSDDDNFGLSEVFVPSANHVVALQGDCCDSSASGSDLLFSSTNGGKSFGTPVRVGTMGVDTAALVGNNILFAGGDNGGGAQIASVSLSDPGPPATIATAINHVAVDIGVSSYRNGALVAADDDGSPDTTRVAYAPAGSNFQASGSYHAVGTFSGQSLIAISGGALLTAKTSGNDVLELRLFNGSTFGPAHQVPDTKGGGPEWFGLDQDPSGRVHVFNESTHLAPLYYLFEESTSTGASWSRPVDLGNAIDSGAFAAGLDAHGSGLVLGNGGSLAIGYPVLASQSVSFTLKKSSIKKGHKTTGSGTASAAAPGRKISLQVELSGRWYTIATTHEGAGGKFSFSVKGSKTGRHTYRAVASDLAGYVLYGYSAARTLRVTS
jgi:hypothetical protein